MEETIKNTTQVISILLTGLSAGLFYAWQVSVIPGTKKISDQTYVEVMQNINREILNPWFFTIFFGSMIVMIISSGLEFRSGISPMFWLTVIATVLYSFGTFGVTAFGNVPLNNALEAIDFSGMSLEKINEIRLKYETDWNKLHLIRTAFSVLAMVLLIVATKIK